MNKKRKNNGFTLVELLAVITILGLLALLASSAVSSLIRGSRNDKESINIDTILNASYDYAQKMPSILPEAGETKAICAMELINCGLLKSEIIEDSQMQDPFDEHVITIQYVESVTDAKKDDKDGEIKDYKYFGKYKFTYVKNNGNYSCGKEETVCKYLSSKDSNKS